MASPTQITKCWRKGCTKFMINGYDHPGLCTVVVAQTRRLERQRSFALLDVLPSDLLLHLACVMPAPSVLMLEQTSRRMLDALRESQTPIWYSLLRRLLHKESSHFHTCRSSLQYRLLYRALHGPLEVKGWASSDKCEAGDMNAWWRCRAVGLKLTDATAKPASVHGRGKSSNKKKSMASGPACCPPGCPTVLVRYDGYASVDDEWRASCSLRRSVACDPHFCTRQARRVGESIECSAKPCDGHPSALWQATIASRVRKARKQHGAAGPSRVHRDRGHPNKDFELLVHFNGFEDEFDEWVAADSKRVRPPGAEGGGVCASFRAATGGATTDYQVMALELAQALGLSAALDAPTDAP